jgi:hypothetical protein
MAQLHLAPPDATTEALRKLAAKEGISLNAYLTPYLNDIAQGRLTRGPQWVTPQQGQKAA